MFTENTIKVIVIQESDLLADLCIGQIRIAKKLHCLLDAQVRDLLPLGAYVAGADPATDRAVALYPRIEAYLHQGVKEATALADNLVQLEGLMA